MKISVIGTGYVGLVSGVCLAEIGHDVTCVDIDREKVEQIGKGISPIYEKGLSDLLKKNINGNFNISMDLPGSIKDTDLSLIAVGTPFDGNEIDLTFIKQAARDIGLALKDTKRFHAVIVKSTVVPGTTDQVVLPILEAASGKTSGTDFGVGMNPEFLREGEAVEDFMSPDRIVLGSMDERTGEMLEALYAPFRETDKIKTSTRTAEMIKYTSNALLATMISFSNEIGNLCSALGDIDVTDVMSGVHLDKRLSPITQDGKRITPSFVTYLEAGCGFGGSCFPKDVKALISHGRRAGVPMTLLDSVIEINRNQPEKMLQILEKHIGETENAVISVMGLAFKPGTDDMRESPSIPIIRDLLKKGARIQAYDPVASDEAKKIFGNSRIVYCRSIEESLDNSDAALILTRWDEFSRIPGILNTMSNPPVLIDGRRMINKNDVRSYDGPGL